jgi:transcription initiation factor TFIIA large subunit
VTNFNVQRAGQTQNSQTDNGRPRIVQVDGPNSSDEDDDEDEFNDQDEEHDDDDDDQNDDENDYPGEEEEPLNSEDDVSDEDPSELFDTDNVVVCQYDKVRFNSKLETIDGHPH